MLVNIKLIQLTGIYEDDEDHPFLVSEIGKNLATMHFIIL